MKSFYLFIITCVIAMYAWIIGYNLAQENPSWILVVVGVLLIFRAAQIIFQIIRS